MDLQKELMKRSNKNRKLILKFKSQGLTNAQIARLLGISRERVGQLVKKYGLNNENR